MKLSKRIKKIQKLQAGMELPWEVTRLYGKPDLWGDQVRFGCDDNDSGTIEEHQAAIRILAREFGLEELIEVPDMRPFDTSFYVRYDRGDGSLPQIRSMSDSKTWPELVLDFMRFLTLDAGPGFPIAEESFAAMQKAMDKDLADRINKFVIEGIMSNEV
jgi:hypothetical protein